VLTVDVTHRLGRFDLHARFDSGSGLTALFGASGAGKTTLINLIAGLQRPDRGRISVDDAVLVDTDKDVFVPKHKRRIGYIFQDARLFPHLTVRQNLLFGRWFAPETAPGESLESVVDLLGIGHLLQRSPSGLSGGEKQRVAIGRALLANPRLLLMDEPLASLDIQRKDEILPYIERLRDIVRIPIVFVSHAAAEVARLATTVVVMSHGHVAAVGNVTTVMSRLDVAAETDRFEAGAIMETTVATHDETYFLTQLSSPGGIVTVPRLALPAGTPVRVRIRARDVMIATEKPTAISALNVLSGKIAAFGPAEGSARDVTLDLSGQQILANLTLKSIADLGLAPGKPVYAIVKSVAIDGAVRSAG